MFLLALLSSPLHHFLKKKVASALILQMACEYLQQCSCRSHRGLLEGMVGLLTTSAPRSPVPLTTASGGKGREVHNYQAHVTPRLQTHSHCSGSAASSRKVTFLFEIPFSKILLIKKVLIFIYKHQINGEMRRELAAC